MRDFVWSSLLSLVVLLSLSLSLTVNICGELNLRRLEWVVNGELNVKKEQTILVRSLRRAGQSSLPSTNNTNNRTRKWQRSRSGREKESTAQSASRSSCFHAFSVFSFLLPRVCVSYCM
jgi:hypothetical protein